MKVDRLVSIIMILLDKERIGAQELAEMFEVSPRTIYRDIDAINQAGIPVRATAGVGGGFEIMPNYKLEKNVFSTADLSAILMGLSGLSSMVHGEELIHALAKVKHFIPAESADEIALKVNQVYIDLSPWMGNRKTQPFLEMLKTAIEERRLLSFTYVDHHGNQTVRTAEPYQLVLKNSHWYWQGFCHTRNDFRLFKLSRMTSLQMQEENFIPREYQRPQLDFSDILEDIQTKIKIRIHRSVMDAVLEYCPYEDFTADGEKHYLVDFPFIENDYYYNTLFGFGNKCECLGPSHVRAGMKQRIAEMAALYE